MITNLSVLSLIYINVNVIISYIIISFINIICISIVTIICFRIAAGIRPRGGDAHGARGPACEIGLDT